MASIKKWQQVGCRGVGLMLAMLFAVAACGNGLTSEDKPQQILDRLISAARANNEADVDKYVARGSELDLKGFLKHKESTNTEELIRRTKIRAFTEVLLVGIESYSLEAEKDINANTKQIDVTAAMQTPSQSSQQVKLRISFIREDGGWKLTDIKGR